MRTAALSIIIICELIIALTWRMDVDTGSLNFMTTMVVVVVTAFTLSAFLRLFKKLALGKNYAISGVVGVAVGLLYYSWIQDHLENSLDWLQSYGLYVMLISIGICAIWLYMTNHSRPKKEKKIEPVKEELVSPQTEEGSNENQN